MACCPMAPSHYLNQCWFIIIGVLWHSPESGFTRGAHEFICNVCWKIIFGKFQPHLPGANELNACSVNAKLPYIPRIMAMRFVAFCFGIGPYSTHILQGYFTGTGAIKVPVPVKQPCLANGHYLNQWCRYVIILRLFDPILARFLMNRPFYPSASGLEGYCRYGPGGRAAARLAEPISL